MGRCNQLFQDEQERLLAEWLAAHPGATEEEAYYAVHGDEPEPNPADEYAMAFDYAVMKARS